MICIRLAYSDPGKAAERDLHLAAHKAFLRSGRLLILQSGPVFDAEGQQAGALVVAETPDLATMRELCAEDPFAVHGIYDRTLFMEWRLTLGQIPQIEAAGA